MYQQNNNSKKKSMHFPAVMFLGLLITCVVVIAAVLGNNVIYKGDDLILSISVDTFFTRISIPKLQHPEIYNISVV